MALSEEEKQLIDTAIAATRQKQQLDELEARAINALAEAKQIATECNLYYKQISHIISEKTICFPWLADALAKFHEAADLKLAEFLESKVHPAVGTADKVRALARERRDAVRAFHLARFRVKYYESLFPWLEEYVDDDLDELVRQDQQRLKGVQDDDDPVQTILTRLPPAEYNTLTPAQRNQRALDIWRQSRRKSKWEIGRDYERYLGYLFEQDGFHVSYTGATEHLEDMGRDLVCRRGGCVFIVQAKYWADHKQIHEKHIFQLYGTAVQFSLEQNNWRPSPQGS